MKVRCKRIFASILLASLANQVKADNTIGSLDDLTNAFENGGVFVLENNLTLDSLHTSLSLRDSKALEIDFKGYAINANKENIRINVASGTTLHLSNGTLSGYLLGSTSPNSIVNRGTMIFDNMILDAKSNRSGSAGISNKGSESGGIARFTMNGGKIANHLVRVGNGRGFGAGFYSGPDNESSTPLIPYNFVEFNGVQFLNNVIEEGYGGAICNGNSYGVSILNINNCVFDGNVAKETLSFPNPTDSSVGGGAIANILGIVTIVDSVFKNNYSDMGGAIINRYFMTIRADNSDVLFENNYMINNRNQGNIKGANDIYLNTVFSNEEPDSRNHTLLEAKKGRNIVFHGGIRGSVRDYLTDSEGNSVIDEETGGYVINVVAPDDNRVGINKTNESGEYSGAIIFEKTAIVRGVNFELHNGTMVVGHGDVFYNGRDKFDPVKDRQHLQYRNNFALYGGTLDLSRLITGTFSVENLFLSNGNIRFGTIREYNMESLMTGTQGWETNTPEYVVLETDCLGNYNRKLDYVLIDYVNNDLAEEDLQHFSLNAGHYGEGWELVIVDGDLVLHWDGDDDGGGGCPDPHPQPEPEPKPTIVPSIEKIGTIVENSLWGSDTNLRTMGSQALAHLNAVRMKSEKCRNIWGQGIGDFSRQRSRGNIDGFTYSGGGYAVGIDHCLCENIGYMGAAFGQIWGKMKGRDLPSTIDQRSEMATLYWGNLVERNPRRAWLFKGAISYGNTDNCMNSYYSDGAFSHGKWDNKTWYLQSEASYRMETDKGWVFAPFTGLDFSHGKRDAFKDEGFMINDRFFASSSLKRLTIPVGLQIDKISSLNGKTWFNSFRLSYEGDIYRKNPSARAYMHPNYEWHTASVNKSRNMFVAEYYTSIDLGNNWQTYAGYNLEASNGTVTHQVNAGVGYSF